MIRNILPLVALVSAVACGGSAGPARAASRSGVITAAQIAEISPVNAYDVVEKLRRGWLVSRGPNSARDPTPAYPRVYVDGLEAGELPFLRAIAASVVAQITFLSTTESNLLYGPGHFGGIIHVVTKR